ncbi:MAG TPA: glycosyl hydrolase family 18 protein [Pontiella sp.]
MLNKASGSTKKQAVLYGLLFVLIACSGQKASAEEIWAYLMKGEEKYFPAHSPITDVACFSASINADGQLTEGYTTPPALAEKINNMRFHLVITMPWNTTLAHIYLDPKLPFRQQIINDIKKRSLSFDGIQIDFESIHANDRDNYLSFLSELKQTLPKDKIFSVAVIARWESHKKKYPNDAFDYHRIGQVADRVIVMAYDEHYRSGSPGPIASLPWCKNVYNYALETIPPEKILMGVPLYGRSWPPKGLSKSFRNPEIWTDIRKKKVSAMSSAEEGGSYSYSTNVTIQVHFESMPSLNAKMALYHSQPIKGIAFWRIGQEPLRFWENIK